jgi:hypothetical protein
LRTFTLTNYHITDDGGHSVSVDDFKRIYQTEQVSVSPPLHRLIKMDFDVKKLNNFYLQNQRVVKK